MFAVLKFNSPVFQTYFGKVGGAVMFACWSPANADLGTYKFTPVCLSVCLSVCMYVCMSHLYLKNGSKDFFENCHDDLGP